LYFYLERHEGALARMYRYFAKAFPTHAAFWLEIARQEMKHARWIMALQHRPDENTVSLSGVQFNPHLIQESIAKVERTTHACLTGKLTLRQALETALEFEHGVIESNCFKVFKFKGERGLAIQRMLEQETDDHRQRIQQLLAETTASG
jgi:rubrerythrin